MAQPPTGTPIKDLTFAQLQAASSNVVGWTYPKHDISQCVPLFTPSQRAALNLYGWVSILLVPAGIALSIYMASWWWLLLIPASYVTWKSNRKSMEQFFIENLEKDARFYDAIRRTDLGNSVKVVMR